MATTRTAPSSNHIWQCSSYESYMTLAPKTLIFPIFVQVRTLYLYPYVRTKPLIQNQWSLTSTVFFYIGTLNLTLNWSKAIFRPDLEVKSIIVFPGWTTQQQVFCTDSFITASDPPPGSGERWSRQRQEVTYWTPSCDRKRHRSTCSQLILQKISCWKSPAVFTNRIVFLWTLYQEARHRKSADNPEALNQTFEFSACLKSA